MKRLPNTLDAQRHIVQYRDHENVYILVGLLNGVPVEIFSSFDSTANHETFYTHAAWNTMTRLASMCLQSTDMGLEATIKQLERSSLGKKDAPWVLLSVLKKYVKEQAHED